MFTKISQEREAVIVISIKEVNYKWSAQVSINRYITKAEEWMPKGLAIGRVMDGVPRASVRHSMSSNFGCRFIPISNSVHSLIDKGNNVRPVRDIFWELLLGKIFFNET